MAMTDPISDMLTRIRNAGMARHVKLAIPSSKLKVAITDVLKSQGYIKNYKVITDDVQDSLVVYLKYDSERKHVINAIMLGLRISHRSEMVLGVRSYQHLKVFCPMPLPVKLRLVASSSAPSGS